MAVQKSILTRTGETITISEGKTFAGAVGKLAIGKPGDIVAKAFGPLTYVENLSSATEFGTFVAGKGILVNSNDVPFTGTAADPFGTTITLPAGAPAAFMTFGTCVVKCKNVAAIKAGLNTRVLTPDYNPSTDYSSSDEVCEVEVTGFAALDAAVAKNTEDIAKNTEDIAKNAEDIADHEERIAALEA